MRISDWSSDVCSSDLVPAASPCRAIPTAILEASTWTTAGRRSVPSATLSATACAAKSSSAIARTTSGRSAGRSEEHTSELQSLMRISYAVFCLEKKTLHGERNDETITVATCTTHIHETYA